VNVAGEVEQMLTDDNETPPKERTKRTLFLAKTIGIDVDKESFTITKKMILQEIKRRDARIKVKNTKNTTNESLMAVLPDVMDARPIFALNMQSFRITSSMGLLHTHQLCRERAQI
jgi:hypothetical protein